MNIGNKIKMRRTQVGKTQQEVADYVGVTKSAVSKWETGDIMKVGIDKLISLSEILMIDPMDIVQDKDFTNEVSANESNTAHVPLLKWDVGLDTVLDYVFVDNRLKADFALTMVDQSLSNFGINEDDILVFNETPELQTGDVILIEYHHTLLLKELELQDDNAILHSRSEDYNTIVIKRSDLNVRGKLTSSFRRW